jgi:hypothetical protein
VHIEHAVSINEIDGSYLNYELDSCRNCRYFPPVGAAGEEFEARFVPGADDGRVSSM